MRRACVKMPPGNQPAPFLYCASYDRALATGWHAQDELRAETVVNVQHHRHVQRRLRAVRASRLKAGREQQRQILRRHALEPAGRAQFDELLHQPNTDVAEMMKALRGFLGENDMMAYLTMMANRLLQLHRVLKSTGSLYLHCDPTTMHQ